MATLDQGDVALVEEGGGRSDGILEIAARIIAQIEDEAGELAAGLLPQFLHGRSQRGRSAIVETGQPQIADIAFFDPRGDGLKIIGGSLDRDLDRRSLAALQDQRHHAAGGPVQLALAFGQGELVDRLFVDRKDQIAGLHPSRSRRRAVAWRDHLKLPFVEREHHADTDLVVGGWRTQGLVFSRVEIGGARIEPRQHAADRRADQLGVGDRIDRVLTNALEGFVE